MPSWIRCYFEGDRDYDDFYEYLKIGGGWLIRYWIEYAVTVTFIQDEEHKHEPVPLTETDKPITHRSSHFSMPRFTDKKIEESFIPKRYLTTREAAKYTGFSESSLRGYSYEIAFVEGKPKKFDIHDLDRWMQSKKISCHVREPGRRGDQKRLIDSILERNNHDSRLDRRQGHHIIDPKTNRIVYVEAGRRTQDRKRKKTQQPGK